MNYLFFFPDEMRASALSCYGNPYVKTPNYDRLAAMGTVFEGNYTPHPVCVASRCSLMTGWYPHVAGFRSLENVMQPHHPNFLKTIHDGGFSTHLYGKNHVFSQEVFLDCVDHFLDADFGHGVSTHLPGNVPETTRSYPKTDRPQRIPGLVPPEEPDDTMLLSPLPDSALESLPDTRCVRAAVEAIRGHRPGDPPLFLFLPTLYPHAPYCITETFYNSVDPDTLPPVLPPDLAGKPLFQKLIRQYRGLEQVPAKVFQKVQAVYYGMCAYCDMLLGRLLDALEEKGLLEDFTIIASSDHGDWAGDWGLVEKWPNAMDEALVRVPLLIARPGGPKGHRVKALTQSFDIFPTILDWEGLPISHDQFGVSLAKEVAGGPGDPLRCVFTEGGYDRREPHCFEGTPNFARFMQPGHLYAPKMIQQQEQPDSACRTVMMRTPTHKLVIRTNGENELYHMFQDPQELQNLFHHPQSQPLSSTLQSQLLTWLIHTSDSVGGRSCKQLPPPFIPSGGRLKEALIKPLS